MNDFQNLCIENRYSPCQANALLIKSFKVLFLLAVFFVPLISSLSFFIN